VFFEREHKTHLLCFREEFFQVLKFFIAEAWV
jgi:hypothetical protein